MVAMVFLILIGIAMGRLRRPWWWPAGLAAAVFVVAMFAKLAASGAVPSPGATDLAGTAILYLATAFYSFGVGTLWRHREDRAAR